MYVIKNILPLNWPWNPAHLILDKEYVYDSGKRGINWEAQDNSLKIIDGYWHIKEGYTWNGTTWVPDGPQDPTNPKYPISWKASVVHDIGYANMRTKGFPYKKGEIDRIFYNELKKAGFKYALLYYTGVVIFGGLFTKG